MSALNDFIDTINEQIDAANDYNPAIKLVICLIATAIAFYFIKYGVVRPWGRVVMSTETAWDDKLHRPIANRAYFFLFVGSTQLSTLWVSGQADFNDGLAPYFSAIYILTATSIASVSVKHIIPMVMDRFTEKSSVTVSGSNPLTVSYTHLTLPTKDGG